MYARKGEKDINVDKKKSVLTEKQANTDSYML